MSEDRSLLHQASKVRMLQTRTREHIANAPKDDVSQQPWRHTFDDDEPRLIVGVTFKGLPYTFWIHISIKPTKALTFCTKKSNPGS